MATHALPSSHILDDDDAPPRSCAGAVSLLRRLYVAILVSQMRRAQREIDRMLGPARCNAHCAPRFRRSADFIEPSIAVGNARSQPPRKNKGPVPCSQLSST